MNIGGRVYSVMNTIRDRYAPVSHKSTFRETGEITPEEFVAAGDYLVYKFPTWSWADADPESKRSKYLPPGKQFLVTRNVPCHRRLNENFAGDAVEGTLIADGFGAGGKEGGGDDDDGWLNTGGGASGAKGAAAGAASSSADRQSAIAREVRTVDDAGNAGERAQEDDDDDIPDMEDEEDDEAIIRDADPPGQAGRRTYNLYIMYSQYYRTPRIYLSGYHANGQPLPPRAMMDDIMGDYSDKTVTLEDFPRFSSPVQMASVHPCKHAPVMKSLLDRADAALKLRREKLRAGNAGDDKGVEGLTDEVGKLSVSGGAAPGSSSGNDKEKNDEWEDIQHDDAEGEEVAIRVDQYLVVFLKFIASVTPGIEHDYTMSL